MRVRIVVTPLVFSMALALALAFARQARAEPSPNANAVHADLAGFVDGVVEAHMRAKGVAGVTVSIVKRDGVLLTKGYGIGWQDPSRAIDPATSLFRIASISKTFTYVAAMQLVEQGMLDLQEDVNRYLPAPLRVPDEGYGAVRVWNLMTHTAGFEDGAIPHLFRLGNHPVEALDDYLARFRPHRVRAPGSHADYSNYSVALLGAIVAHVSGETFESYTEAHLFAPLGMRHTTFRGPLPEGDPRRAPEELLPDFSTGFHRAAGGYKAEPHEHGSHIAPAGNCSSTAQDMTRWMRMLLGGGTVDGVRILAPDTFREMATVTFRNAHDVPGLAHGFFRALYGRYESLEHSGATISFHSSMVVLPDGDLGVFVATNTDTGRELADALPDLVLERMLPESRPAPPPAPTPTPEFAASAKRFAGMYVSERRAYTTLEKVMATLAPTTVAPAGDGTLRISAHGGTRRWVQDGPVTFRAIETGERIQFLEDGAGRVTGFATASGSAVQARVGALENPMILGIGGAVLVVVCLGVLVGTWGRRGRGLGPYSRLATFGARVVAAATVVWLSSVVLLGVNGMRMSGDPFDVLPTYPDALFHVMVGLAYAGVGLSLAAFVLFVVGFRGTGWTLGRRVRHALVVVTMLAFSALLVKWGFLFVPYALG